jgi:hypothetical protein
MPKAPSRPQSADEGGAGGVEGGPGAAGSEGGGVNALAVQPSAAVLAGREKNRAAAVARMEAERELGRAIIAKVTRKAAQTIAGLYKRPGERGYNIDADLPWSECSVKTRASLLLVKGMAAEPEQGDGRLFGVIIMQGRAPSAAQWEAEARAVDEDERRKGAIDVVPK